MDTSAAPATMRAMTNTGPRKTPRTVLIGDGLARRLRERREEKGLSQADLADRAGQSKTQILNLEAGRGGGARLDTIHALAEALGVPAGWLAFGG